LHRDIGGRSSSFSHKHLKQGRATLHVDCPYKDAASYRYKEREKKEREREIERVDN